MRVEDGYPDNPYHNRVHAADVLRTLHVLLHRGGVLDAVTKGGAAQDNGEHQQSREGAQDGGGCTDGHASSSARLIACYLAAIVHDFEHR